MARNNLTFADLVAIARRVGVTVVEAPSSHRGKLGTMGTVVGVTCHHTGTANTFRPADEYPDFNVVKEGRAGLENSLSAYGLGRWTTIYVFSEFLSWHAGAWNWKGITDGNGHFLGIEAAGVGDWTPFQREVYPRLVASILLFIGEGIDMAPRHAEGAVPAGRKTDATNFAWFRERVQYFMANPAYININYGAEDDVQFSDKIQFKRPDTGQIVEYTLGENLAWTNWYAGQAAIQVGVLSKTIDALSALVAQQNGLTVDDVRAAVRDEVAKGVDVHVEVNGGTAQSA